MSNLVKVSAIGVVLIGAIVIASLTASRSGGAARDHAAAAAMASAPTLELLAKAAEGQVLHLGNSNFNATIAAAKQPVLVDFWAEWCGPCKTLSPTIDAIAAETKGKAIIAKVDIDRAARIAQQHGVKSIPTLIVFRDGKPVNRIVGVVEKETILAQLR